MIEPAEIIETPLGEALGQPHDYIYIVRVILASRYGTEQGGTDHTGSPELLFVLLQGANDLFAVHGVILAQVDQFNNIRLFRDGLGRRHARVEHRLGTHSY